MLLQHDTFWMGAFSEVYKTKLSKHFFNFTEKRTDKKQDLSTERVTFCSVMQTIYSADVWTRKVAFYLDGVSFVSKEIHWK